MSTLSMLKFSARTFAALLAFAAVSPASHGQDVGMLGQLNVPFAFDSGFQHFSAGVYAIRMENQHTLRIQGKSESGFAMTWVEDDAQAAKTGKAVFHKYGDQYFLSEISIGGRSRHLHFRESRAESQLQIGSKAAPTGVEVALMEGAR